MQHRKAGLICQNIEEDRWLRIGLSLERIKIMEIGVMMTLSFVVFYMRTFPKKHNKEVFARWKAV